MRSTDCRHWVVWRVTVAAEAVERRVARRAVAVKVFIVAEMWGILEEVGEFEV